MLQRNAIVLDVLEDHLLGDRLVFAQQIEQSRPGRYGLHAQVEQLANEPVMVLLQGALVGGVEVFVQILVALLVQIVLVEVLQKRRYVLQ